MRNGRPFAFHVAGKGHAKPVVLCLLPKVGSTTWKLALLSALAPDHHDALLTRSPHHRHQKWHQLERVPLRQLRRATRIMIVRNPYDRLLAAYLEEYRAGLRRAEGLEARVAAVTRRGPPAAAGRTTPWWRAAGRDCC